MLRGILFSVCSLCLFVSPVWAGNIYKVKSQRGDEKVEYQVRFGGGKLEDQYTAFDLESKAFVYLSFPRNGAPPKPAQEIWDHRTGEKIPLYTFPGAKHPLPIIPSIEAMKVCPLTGDKKFKAELEIIVD